jgi:hypothetical protein
MAAVIFTCPKTDMAVQHWLDENAHKHEYEIVTCPACTGMHFVNRKTGRLLGQKGKDPPGPP